MSEYPTSEERQAARKYLEHDHAAQTLGGRAGEEANRHASEIDERHPRARDIAMAGTSRELGNLPGHLRAHQRLLRDQAGIDADEADQMRKRFRSGPPEGEREGRNPRPNRPTRSRSYSSDLISSASDSSLGQLTVQVIAWGIGLSLLYVVLTRAGNVARITNSVSNAVRAIVAVNVDPLNPHGVKAK